MRTRTPIVLPLLLAAMALVPAEAREPSEPKTKVPRWDARGIGPLPWQGVACLDVNDDATRIALGTIAPAGDPNVLLLDGDGRLTRQQRAGQRWINQVALAKDGDVLRALCTMPAGRAGDMPELFRLDADKVAAEAISWRRKHAPDGCFHYGDHSNHVTRLLSRAGAFTAAVNGDQVQWLGATEITATATYPLDDVAIPVAVAGGRDGLVVVGTTAAPLKKDKSPPNLHVLHPSQPKPLWSRPMNTEVDEAPRPEKGRYGKPTLPDGRREELPQRDEKVWAPLAVAVHVEAAGDATKANRLVAAADYQGWQRWVRSSATGKDENLGVRFLPSRPAVTVYDRDGKSVRRFGPDSFARPFWCDLRFLPDGKRLLVAPHSWTSRGLAGQAVLPADEGATELYVLEIASGKVARLTFPDAIADVAVSERGAIVACWDGRVYLLSDKDLSGARVPAGVAVGGPSLVRVSRDGSRVVVAGTNGGVRLLDGAGKERWQTDLNKVVKRGLKPWVENARATPLAKGVWQLPGGRVESDLGGQRLIEAPDGLILIEAHAGLSFEGEWAAIKAVGLDPMRVKYVLATHEHGDHAPGAYLWRVVTGAKFVCSEEMAYTLQHHIPMNTGYGFHPPVPIDVRVTEDTDLDLAGLKVRGLRIPGHTYGSMAWRFEKDGKSFVAFGDLIMPRGVLGYSGSINFSARDVLASLRKLRDLKPDVVLPGHGAVGGPADTLGAGIEVGVAGGWGLIKPEKPDPYFRITQKNVVVVAWNVGATSAAFGDIDGDGLPDVVVVTRAGEGALVKVYLNKGGKFDDKPDHEIALPRLAEPSKVRVLPAGKGRVADLFVAGKSAALLVADGKLPKYKVVRLDLADGNRVRRIDDGDRQQTLIAARFGAFHALDRSADKARLTRFKPEVTGPYVDVQAPDLNGDGRPDLVTSTGHVYLRGADGKLPAEPTLRLEVEKGEWYSLAVGDFNGDKRPDVVLLAYGMHGQTSARVFYNTGKADKPFAEKPDVVIPLNPAKKDAPLTLLRDAPVVCDWDGDGIDDLVIGRGQSQEVTVLLGGRGGLDAKRSRTIALDYRTHYETGVFVGDFNGDGVPDLAVFGYTLTGVGWNGPPAAYIWLQPAREKPGPASPAEMEWVQVARDKKSFALATSGSPFVPWGFNYDRDARGRLIEDYWDAEWPKVEKDFAQMRKLGANVVRVHLQLGKFMDGPDKPNGKALDRLAALLKLAERERLYLDLTGLGCYHKKDVPAWYDKLAEKDRWDVQARFWQAVAARCAKSPAVFCYDLMNEPIVPGGRREDGDWLAPAFAGKQFVQFIALDQGDRPRPDIARQWIRTLVTAIRKADRRHLITVGLVDWSLDRKGLTSGFVPEKVADDLDFLSVHLYPKKGKVAEALETLAGFAVGKPVLVEETFPLSCSVAELEEFIDKSGAHAAGWVGFYWGKPPDELRASKTVADALTLGWLELFQKKGKALRK